MCPSRVSGNLAINENKSGQAQFRSNGACLSSDVMGHVHVHNACGSFFTLTGNSALGGLRTSRVTT